MASIPTGNPVGRPTKYNWELAQFICEKISNGRSLPSVLQEHDDMPSYASVMLWLKQHPEFSELYAQAKSDQADFNADRIAQIAEGTIDGTYDPKAARVAIDAYKWTAAKLKPRVYGDKLQLGGAADLPPIQTTNTLDVSSLTLEQLDALQLALTASLTPQSENV